MVEEQGGKERFCDIYIVMWTYLCGEDIYSCDMIGTVPSVERTFDLVH
jgi:hypothetical protein